MALKQFIEKLSGWKTSPDCGDFCPSCWEKYLKGLSQQDTVIAEEIAQYSCNTVEVAESRQSSDGWLVICDRCDQVVDEPYSTDEVNPET